MPILSFRLFPIYLAFICSIGLVCLSTVCGVLPSMSVSSLSVSPFANCPPSPRYQPSQSCPAIAVMCHRVPSAQLSSSLTTVPVNFAHLAVTPSLCKLPLSYLPISPFLHRSIARFIFLSLSSCGIYVSFVHKINLFLSYMLPTHLLYLPSHLPKAYTFTVSMGSVALYICLLYSHTKFMSAHNLTQHK